MKLYVHALLIILVVGNSSAKPPAPLGLELGKTTEKRFLNLVKQKGWRIEKSGYRIIKGDISNPDVTGYIISGIKLDKLDSATFWFYKSTLFKIIYTLRENMNKEAFVRRWGSCGEIRKC